MKVVIVHYHLNPGGVTRIIESQIQGLKNVIQDIDLVVLSGQENKTADLPVSVTGVCNSLYYSDTKRHNWDYKGEILTIITYIEKHLSGGTILHFHNPNLGKNPSLTMAAYLMASKGYSVINHCHDFAEDRPKNLSFLNRAIPSLSSHTLYDIMYPRYERYHYIVLNSFDYDRLQQYGIPASNVHLLPNPVILRNFNGQADIRRTRQKICKRLGFSSSKKICTYPVRAIQRKNLGEFVLLAVLFSGEAYFALTQPPKNPAELPLYKRWKKFCSDHGITIKFEAGDIVNHEELINISDFCVTTSTREGFGMVYLEPWLAGTPVIGRDLTPITGDLKKTGLKFPRLYNNIMVETRNGKFDFKDLMTDDQEKVITSVLSQESYRLSLLRENPWLHDFLGDFPSEIVFKNQSIVKSEFSLEKYGERLLAIYHEVSQ